MRRERKGIYKLEEEYLYINCSSCNRWKLAMDNYHRSTSFKFGYKTKCKSCSSVSKGLQRSKEDIYRHNRDALEINCTICKEWKLAKENYYKSKYTKVGYYLTCIKCENKEHKARRVKSRIPIIYCIEDREGNILYIGKTTQPDRRIKEHLGIYKPTTITFKDPSVISKVYTKTFSSVTRSIACELYYIAKYKPLMNKRDLYDEKEDELMDTIAESVKWKEYDLPRLRK